MKTLTLNVVCILLLSSLCQTLVQGSSPEWDESDAVSSNDDFLGDHAELVKREVASSAENVEDLSLQPRKLTKRQTELDIQGSRNEFGTHIQGRGSHTFNHDNGDSTTLGGHLGYHSKEGVYGGGVSGSHTFDHGGGRSTTFGANVDFGRGRRPDWGVGFRHTIRFKRSQDAAMELRDRAKRQTELDIQGLRNPSGTHIQGSGSHTFNHDNGDSTTLGGHLRYHSKEGIYGGGLSGSHTFDHGGDRSTTIGVGVDVNTGRSPVWKGFIGHKFRFKRNQDAALELKDRAKRQTTLNAKGSHGSSGTNLQGSFSHTRPHGDRGSSTLEGRFDYNDRAGLAARLGGSHTFNHRNGDSSTLGGHADYHSRAGVHGGGIRGSHTFDHGRGRSTTIGGNVDFGRGRRPDWGVGLTHTIRFKRSQDAALELKDRAKRQTELNIQGSRNPSGTHIQGSGSHTFNHANGDSTRLGGNFGYHSKVGVYGGGVSGSHTFDHGRGRSTTIGGNVDFGRGRRPDWGVGIRHTIRFKRSQDAALQLKDRAKRQTNFTQSWNHGGGSSSTLSGQFGHNPTTGFSGSLDGSHTRNVGPGSSFTLGGNLRYNNNAFNAGLSASGGHQWNSGRTSSSLTGNVAWDARNGFSGAGIDGSHTINHRRGGGSTTFTGGFGVDGSGGPTANAGVRIRF